MTKEQREFVLMNLMCSSEWEGPWEPWHREAFRLAADELEAGGDAPEIVGFDPAPPAPDWPRLLYAALLGAGWLYCRFQPLDNDLTGAVLTRLLRPGINDVFRAAGLPVPDELEAPDV